MRRILVTCLVSVLGCHGGANGQDASTNPSATPSPAVADAPATGEDGAETAEHPATPASVWTQIEALDPQAPESVPRAAALFVEHFGRAKPTEADLKAGVDRFLSFVGRSAAAADREARDDQALHAAACAATARCDAGPVTPQATAELEALAERGVRFVYEGEGMVTAVVDEMAVADLLAPVLSAPTKAYLEAMHWQAGRIDGQYDEDGFGGDPADVAAGLARWEALAKADPAYATVATEQATAIVSQYLNLCDHRGYTKPTCVLDKKLRAAYASFPTTNPDSAYVEVVAKFVEEAKGHRWRMDDEQLAAAIETSLASASP